MHHRRRRPPRRAGVLLAAGAVTLTLAADATTALRAPSGSFRARPDGALRDCRTRGEVGAPITMRVTSRDVRIGPLVIENVRRRDAAGPTRNGEWPFVAKAPVLLPARSRVVLAVAPDAADRAAFQHRGGWVSAVRFTACYERVRAWSYRGTVGKATFFPFAIALRGRAACIPMELWIGARQAPVRRVVPVGRRAC